MNRRHRATLHALFSHPEPANLSGADIKAVLADLGADLEDRTGSRFAVTLNGHTVVFHQPEHSLRKDDIRQIRKFLTDQGVDPVRDYPL